eukprot:1142704-Pelagomonas_calceolata.AAC.5
MHTHLQAAQLQRYWRLRANPRTLEHANSPFSVELNLTDQPPPLLARHSPSSVAGAAAAMAVGLGGQVAGGALLPSRLALLQGPCGRLRVQKGKKRKGKTALVRKKAECVEERFPIWQASKGLTKGP